MEKINGMINVCKNDINISGYLNSVADASTFILNALDDKQYNITKGDTLDIIDNKSFEVVRSMTV